MSALQNIFFLFDKGGVMMYALVAASIVSLAIIIERAVYFNRIRIKSGVFTDEILSHLESSVSQPQIEKALAVCRSKKAPLALLQDWILTHFKNENTDDLEKSVTLQVQKILPKLEERLPLLNTLGSAAPLLGLLGTVLGMIQAFTVMSHGDVASASLAGGISEALLTTAGGLFVAIPCVIAYNIYSRHVDLLLTEMEVETSRLISLLQKHRA